MRILQPFSAFVLAGGALAPFTIGDLLYADSTTTLAKLADVATGQVLISGGVGAAPAYSANPSMLSVILKGSSSGTTTVKPAAAAGTTTITLPAGTTDFSATGGTSFVVKQNSAGAAFTVAQLAASDLSNGTSGTGAVALVDSPVFTTQLTTPIIIGGTTTTSTLTHKTTTGVGTTNADMIFQVGSNGATEAMRILNSGFTGIGIVAPVTVLHTADTSSAAVRGFTVSQHNAAASAALMLMRKSRGTPTSPGAVVNTDAMGAIVSEGHDGTGYIQSALIRFDCTGTIATNRVPGKISFFTATDASPSVETLALTLNANQSATFAAGLTATTLGGTGIITAKSGTATPAGGVQAYGLGTTANFGVYYGSGAPSSLTAQKGSLYLRSDGTGAADRAYINTDSSTTFN